MIPHEGWGIKLILEDVINWLMRNIRKIIDSRMDDLLRKRPGAVLFSPRIIWVKMMNRQFTANHPEEKRVKTMANRKKINDIADAQVPKYDKYILMDISSIMKYPHKNFDNLGNPNAIGKAQYWKELDFHCKKIDREIFNKKSEKKTEKKK